jgi:vacuolar-type H+-ATPase subunit I/STV1
MISLEHALDEALASLRNRLRDLRPEMPNEVDDDEVDSIASSTMNFVNAPHRLARTVRFGASPREMETLRKNLSQMQQENKALRDELARLKSLYGHSDEVTSEEKKEDERKAKIGSEGGVLKFIRGSLSLP